MNRLEYDKWIWRDSDIASCVTYGEISPVGERLGYGTMEAEVKSEDSSFLRYRKNRPVKLYLGGVLSGVYYLQSIERLGPKLYRLSAIDAIGLLAAQKHYGGIYTGQTAESVIREVCGNVNVEITPDAAKERVFGWLPIATRRDNLQQILFATGYAVRMAASGALEIKPLNGKVSSEIRKISADATASYPAPVTKVVLTEHQFIKDDTVEAETLFEGENDGEIIQFDEPCHSLSAEGFTLTESGANYAIVTGTAPGKLVGKPYVHVKREIVRVLDAEADENEASYEDATLISAINADAAADRLEEFLLNQNTVQASIRLNGERPGDVVNILHPFDREMMEAFIESADVTVSGSVKAALSCRIGYLPPASSAFTHSAILTSDGNWTVPDGVKRIRLVLCGGGDGGEKGEDGEKGQNGTPIEPQYNNLGQFQGVTQGTSGKGGAGGAGGKGGKGGKIRNVYSVKLEAAQTVSVKIGAGGAADGGKGGDTVVTIGGKSWSSKDGQTSEYGYTDLLTGKTYGTAGIDGLNGGKGGDGASTKGQIPGGDGQDVGEYRGGIGAYPGFIGNMTNQVLPGGGGGAAFGENGQNVKDNGSNNGNGGRGGNAITSTEGANIPGAGGNGGNGGGGGGAGGGGWYEGGGSWNQSYRGYGAAGGKGSEGKPGASGFVIIFW